MNINEFKILLREFSQTFNCIKSLCEKMRDILFSSLKNEALFIETLSNSFKKLYYSIIEAFNKIIIDIIIKQN